MNKFLLPVVILSFVVMGSARAEQANSNTEKLNQQMLETLTAQLSATASQVTAVASQVSATASAVAAVTPGDNDDWTGDHLQIRGNLSGLKKVCDSNKPATACDTQEYFAPAYLRFDVSKNNANGTILITAKNNFTIAQAPKQVTVTPWKGHGIYGWFSPSFWPDTIDTPVPKNMEPVAQYETYTINKKEIERIPYVKYGWTFGALLAPFKFQRGYKAFNSSNSAQIYLGLKRDSNGTAEGPFISAGLSTVDIATAAGATTNKQGFSYGLGWIFEVKKGSGFHLLAMAGQDVFGANSGYQYEGDVWYSISLGYRLDPSPAK